MKNWYNLLCKSANETREKVICDMMSQFERRNMNDDAEIRVIGSTEKASKSIYIPSAVPSSLKPQMIFDLPQVHPLDVRRFSVART
jgi:hypothetical protein